MRSASSFASTRPAVASRARHCQATLVDIGKYTHAVHIAGIHARYFVQVGADEFQQILNRAVIGETTPAAV